MGLFWIYTGIAIGGIIMILTCKSKYKFFGIIIFLLWPIAFPVFYFIRKWIENHKKDGNNG
jgi:hypothetical protein